MSHWKTLGAYLDRPVKVIEISSREHSMLNDLNGSVLLLALGTTLPMESMRALLRSLIGQRPLAIMVFGAGARAAFDVLIAELSDGVPRGHIMTRLAHDDRMEFAVEELLQSTWPSEDRFDDWKEYAIVCVDGDIGGVERAVEKVRAM